jgi:hypothetical protein
MDMEVGDCFTAVWAAVDDDAVSAFSDSFLPGR